MKDVDELEKLASLREKGVLTEQEYDLAKRQIVSKLYNPDQAPGWMKPWGYYVTFIAAASYALIAYVNWVNGKPEVGLIAGAINPIFWVAAPLGLYWLRRSGEI